MLKPYFKASYGSHIKLRQVRIYKIDRESVGEVISKHNSFSGPCERSKYFKNNNTV